jgi:hypothetical protein
MQLLAFCQAGACVTHVTQNLTIIFDKMLLVRTLDSFSLIGSLLAEMRWCKPKAFLLQNLWHGIRVFRIPKREIPLKSTRGFHVD